MSEKTTGFESAFKELPGATVIDQFSDVKNLMLNSAANFEVRLGRLFLSDSNGKPSDQLNAEYLVACDFDGVPISGPSGPLTFKKVQTRKQVKPAKSPYLLENKIYVPEATKFFAVGNLFALDDPEDSEIDFRPVNGASSRLTEYYKSKTGSTRATLAFDSTGIATVIGLVGSRYAVLQNEEVAADALAFVSSSNNELGFCAPNATSYGKESYFGILMNILHSGQIIGNEVEVVQRLLLHHSHDTSFAYNHVWAVECHLGSLGSAVVGMHKVKIKHTKNIGDRAQLITNTIAEIQEQYKKFIEDMDLFERIDLPKLENDDQSEVNKYLNLTVKVPNRPTDWLKEKYGPTDWLTEKYKNKYFKEVGPFLGFNLRSLYLAVALAEGSYWDGRISTSGLPALLDLPKSFQTRRDARIRWVEEINLQSGQ